MPTTLDSETTLPLVAALGRDDFGAAFADACLGATGADQVTAFAGRAGRVRALVAARPGEPALADRLCRRYADGFHRRDLFLARSLAARVPQSVATVRSADIDDPDYRRSLFDAAGLGEKVCLLARSRAGFVYLNVYYRSRRAGADRAAAFRRLAGADGRLLLALLAKHDAMSDGAGPARAEALLRDRYPALSVREAEICARLATGRNAMAIAADLGLSPATVATFRKRAYAKLGITSQAALFARLAGLIA